MSLVFQWLVLAFDDLEEAVTGAAENSVDYEKPVVETNHLQVASSEGLLDRHHFESFEGHDMVDHFACCNQQTDQVGEQDADYHMAGIQEGVALLVERTPEVGLQI
jgi:hypothetical protein